RVVAEDVGDLGADDGAEAVVQQRPRRMLARGAAAKIAAGHQNGAACSLWSIEREVGLRRAVRVVAPVCESLSAQAFFRGRSQKARGDDLVRVDIRVRQDSRARGKAADRLHGYDLRNSRGSEMRPATAAAAAVRGLASNVRAPLPWRPSKLRLLVLTAYWPLATTSPFMPMHIEQPDSRHSAPASVNTWASPRASASRLICCEPGTTSMRTPLATLRPRLPRAAR